MKKHLLLFNLILICFTAQSQLTKGNWLLGGNGKFYSYKAKYSSATYATESSYTQIDLSPNLGYFVADKLAVGLKPTFSSIKGEVTTAGGGSTNVQRYWLGPFGRYYFLDINSKGNFVADISYQFGTYGGIAKGKLGTFSALAGPVVFFNSSVGLEFLLGYSYSKEDAEGYQKEERKGLQIAVGFQIHLDK